MDAPKCTRHGRRRCPRCLSSSAYRVGAIGAEVERKVKALVVGWRALRTTATPEQFARVRPQYDAFVSFKDAMLTSAWARLMEDGALKTAEQQYMAARQVLTPAQRQRVPVVLEDAPGVFDELVTASKGGLSSGVAWILAGGALYLYLTKKGA